MGLLFTNLLVFLSCAALGQAKLIINGGFIFINNGATLIIGNSDNTAISQTGSGNISTEGINSRLIWSVGSGNGNIYRIPFGNSSGNLPLHFSTVSGSTDERMIFSTYPTPSWKNSVYLPPGVTTVNDGGNDNSAKLIDQFWQINTQGYVTKPTLSNLSFSYSKME